MKLPERFWIVLGCGVAYAICFLAGVALFVLAVDGSLKILEALK